MRKHATTVYNKEQFIFGTASDRSGVLVWSTVHVMNVVQGITLCMHSQREILGEYALHKPNLIFV